MAAWELLIYVAVLWMVTHTFVVFYEERVLSRTFGRDYDNCRQQVRSCAAGCLGCLAEVVVSR